MDENLKRAEFAQCWVKAEPSISAYVFAAVAGFHDAEDVVQRIAQELARRFDEYDTDRPFLGWAHDSFAISKNRSENIFAR